MAVFGTGLRNAKSGLIRDPVQRAVGSPDWLLPATPSVSALAALPTIVAPDSTDSAVLTPIRTIDWTATLSIPSQLTFSRSSSGTSFNSVGQIATATSNVARFEYTYDGSSWDSAGLLIEEQRTNLVLQSGSLAGSGGWANDGSTTTANSTTSPDGGTNASKIVESAASGVEHRDYQSFTVTPGGLYVWSIFAKRAERNWIAIRSSAGIATANFNLNTGTVGTTGGTNFVSASIQNVGNGWFRCIMVATGAAVGTDYITINLGDADTGTGFQYLYTGNGSSGLYVWGAQVEAGAFPTSYIPTTTATVTRSADIVSSTDAGLLAAQGWAIEVGELPSSVAATLLGINTGIGLGATSGNALTTADGGTQTTGNTGAWASQNRGGIAFDSTPRVSIDLDGDTVTTAANTPVTPTALYFGNTNNGASGFLNGHIRSWAAYSAVSDSQLQTVSAVGASYTLLSTGVADSVGAASGAGAAAAVGSALATGVGSASGAGAAAGVGSSIAVAVGTAAGGGAATATGASLARGVGSASGAGAASGVGTSKALSVGSAAGSGAASGTGASTALATGSAAGSGAATATGKALATGVGSAAGSGAASGTGASTAAGVGSAAGSGAATAVGRSTAIAAGSAAGAGAATGVAFAGASTGTAAGAGTATGVGRSIVTAVGTAAGSATVTATGASLVAAIGSAAGGATVIGVGASISTTIWHVETVPTDLPHDYSGDFSNDFGRSSVWQTEMPQPAVPSTWKVYLGPKANPHDFSGDFGSDFALASIWKMAA